jgi:hypothetical protein
VNVLAQTRGSAFCPIEPFAEQRLGPEEHERNRERDERAAFLVPKGPVRSTS